MGLGFVFFLLSFRGILLHCYPAVFLTETLCCFITHCQHHVFFSSFSFSSTTNTCWTIVRLLVYPLKGERLRKVEAGVLSHMTLYSQVKSTVLHRVQLFAAPWSVAHPAPLFVGFPRQEYWHGLPFPTPGNLSDPHLLCFLHCRWILYLLSHWGSPLTL